MNVLFVGNSQLSALVLAYNARLRRFGTHNSFFYTVPGGEGPRLVVEKGKLVVVDQENSPYPPRFHPLEAAERNLDSYDVVVVSALGYLEGGVVNKSQFYQQGVIHEFQPRQDSPVQRLLSRDCFHALAQSYLATQRGSRFLALLRQEFRGRILVQPFPLISSAVQDEAEWPLNAMYVDPLLAQRFFLSARAEFLTKWCSRHGAELLPYPDGALEENGLFTRQTLMRSPDGVHGNAEYGELVFRQLEALL